MEADHRRYFSTKIYGQLAVGLCVLLLAYAFGARPWMRHWGATTAEAAEALPGDDFVGSARMQVTRAVTLDGPPEQVWPWLIQIGTGRAGWYSYDCLDNGCRPSAESILPEWQKVKKGDKIPISPDGKANFPIEIFEKNKVLGLGGRDGDFGAMWAMVLKPLEGGKTRLIIRFRMRLDPWYCGIPSQLLLEPAHFIMERKMLLELKRRLAKPR